MISIVSGTINRLHLLPELLNNTLFASDLVELILVDGGSTDGTLEYLRSINHPRFKLIEVGQRSSYPHYMNLGIKAATHALICQWNDDVLIETSWEDVYKICSNTDYDMFVFKWFRERDLSDFILFDKCINFGIYNKDIFRKIGLYSYDYQYYHCDSDMTIRALAFGYKLKLCGNIVVRELNTPKTIQENTQDQTVLFMNSHRYKQKKLSKNIIFLD